MWPFPSRPSPERRTESTFRLFENERGPLDSLVNVPDDIALRCNARELFGWGIFNPYGPTLSLLSLLEHSNSGLALVHHRQINPFAQSSGIIAVTERSPSAKSLTDLMKAAFYQNHFGMANLVTEVPSLLLIGGPSGLSELCLHCFDAHFEANGRTPEVLEQLDRFRRFPGRPWDRATEELNSAMKQLQQRASSRSAPQAPPPAYDQSLLFAWAECLFSDAHRFPELVAFLNAWTGSINAQKGNLLAREAFTVRQLLKSLATTTPFMAMQFHDAVHRLRDT